MTQIQFVGPDEIRPHLNIESLLEPVKGAFIAFSRGDANAPIYVLHPTPQSDIHVKSAVIRGWPFFTVKMAGWSQTLVDRGEAPSSGMIAVFDARTCRPVAILQDDHLISDYRTAAAGALAAQYLSRPESKTVVVIGTGIQAKLQALAIAQVRPIEKIVIWGRRRTKAEALARSLSTTLAEVEVTVHSNLQEAIRFANIVVVATTAKEPVVFGDWLQSGQHITSVGSDDASKCELHVSCLSRADAFIVDSNEAARSYGNLHRALREDTLIADRSIVELGAVLDGKHSGRESNEDITVASFVGLGIQDLAAVSALSSVLLS